MIHRVFVGLAVSACVVACVTETTSLGGPRGNQASASSEQDGGADPDATTSPPELDGGEGEWSWHPPAYESMDAGRPGAWPCGYSWMPVPGPGACEYVFPSERQNDSPDLDSATWDPRNVRVDVWATSLKRAIGGYKATVDECAADHGWYHLSSSDGGRPTSYALCPTTCAYVMSDGGEFRLSAFGWCGPLKGTSP